MTIRNEEISVITYRSDNHLQRKTQNNQQTDYYKCGHKRLEK